MSNIKNYISILLVLFCLSTFVFSQAVDLNNRPDYPELTNQDKKILNQIIMQREKHELLASAVNDNFQITNQNYLQRDVLIKSLIEFIKQNVKHETELSLRLLNFRIDFMQLENEDDFGINKDFFNKLGKLEYFISFFVDYSISELESKQELSSTKGLKELASQVRWNQHDIDQSISNLNKSIHEYNEQGLILNNELHNIPHSTIEHVQQIVRKQNKNVGSLFDEIEFIEEYKEYEESTAPKVTFD